MSSDASTADFRALLEQEGSELRAKLAELGAGGDRPRFDPNFADSSQVTAERGELEALVQSLTDALEEVERALAKLRDGTYGRCERCGEPIAPARLEAMPASRYCIACAARTTKHAGKPSGR